jgi:hypothetical protein
MRSTVARRLSTLWSFYRYGHLEGLLARNPAANVRRPKIEPESRTLGLDRNELGPLLVQAGVGAPPPGGPAGSTRHRKRWQQSTTCVTPDHRRSSKGRPVAPGAGWDSSGAGGSLGLTAHDREKVRLPRRSGTDVVRDPLRAGGLLAVLERQAERSMPGQARAAGPP